MRPQTGWLAATLITGLSLFLLDGISLDPEANPFSGDLVTDSRTLAPQRGSLSPSIQESRKTAFLADLERLRNLPEENDLPSLRLTPEERKWVGDLYRQTPREQLNWRGTLLFLFSRNAELSSDLDFIEKVLREPPCLSLRDCTRRSNEDEAGSSQTTLDYPRKVVRYQLERKRRELPPSDPLRQRIEVLLRY